MKRKSWKIVIVFSILTFLILTNTVFFIILFGLFLNRSGVLHGKNPWFVLTVFTLLSLFFGILIARLTEKWVLEPIIRISDASNEVAKGNFTVALNEDRHFEEFQVLYHNFNKMMQELSQTEMMRNDFIENVSHEFKTPLSCIEGYATLMQKPGLSEEQRLAYASKIITSSRRLSDLTGNILLLSRLEHQEGNFPKESYALDEQIREILLLLENKWEEKNLDLDINLDPIQITANKEILSQVWGNLLSNAVRFSPQNGQIYLSLFIVKSEIHFLIRDQRPGMDPDVQHRIFEKFYQGDSSRSDSGNGLGLALAKKAVELHAGSISVESTLGKGAAFTVILPY